MRQSDISFQKTAYRITVRQLESLVRLSEALARVHLEEYILPAYVREASRLLKKSIINVDMPSVELDNFEERVKEERSRLVVNSSLHQCFLDIISPVAHAISFNNFNLIDLIVSYIRSKP